MSVGTWGYGTGATSAAAHPFSLCIQGIDVISAVPMESITVSGSVSGNATLSFTIIDTRTGPLTAFANETPEGWADVVFTDHTEGEVIFSGLVMSVELSLRAPPSRVHQVQCVDYGILLDVAPVPVAISTDVGFYISEAVQAVAGVAPLGGLTATVTTGTPGLRLETPAEWTGPVESSAWATARSAISSLLPGGYNLWVSPGRAIAAMLPTTTWGSAPLAIRSNPSTSGHVAANDISITSDFRTQETGVYVDDSDKVEGGDNSGFFAGTVNGYTVAPASTSRAMFNIPIVPPPGVDAFPTEVAGYGSSYVAAHGATTVGQATVTSAKNFFPGQALTVYYSSSMGLDGTYAIHAVQTSFLGGPGLLRRTEIQFGGELGTVARFNRTRFARAGVTT